MANYHIALQEVLKNEGGYVNDPDDSGGETYKGIARRFHPDWIGWAYVDNRDFKNPNLDKLVSDFYYIKFWDHQHRGFFCRCFLLLLLSDWSSLKRRCSVFAFVLS